jgi:hypothetical protein
LDLKKKNESSITADSSSSSFPYFLLEEFRRNLQNFATIDRPLSDSLYQLIPPPLPTTPPQSQTYIGVSPQSQIDSLYELVRPPPTQRLLRQQSVDVNGEFCGMGTRGTLIMHGGIFNHDGPLSDSLG